MFKAIILSLLTFYSGVMITNDINLDIQSETDILGNKIYNLNETNLLLTPEKINSPYIFNNVLEVIEAINKSEASKMTLLVSPSVYWIDNPDDPAIRYPATKGESTPFSAEIKCDTLSIIGLTANPEDVVFLIL